MDIRSLKNNAAEALAAAPYHPQRLALLHAGVSLSLSLVLSLIHFLLSLQLSNTGGLSGIGLRTVLSSIQLIATILVCAFIPFWDMGFFRVTLNLSRREPAQPATLLSGFYRFGPVLRLMLLRFILCALVVFFCLEAGSMLFMMTPLSNDFLEQAQAIIAAGTQFDPQVVAQLMPSIFPVYIISGVLLCVVLIPLLYRLRLADFAVMDNAPGALAAMRKSSRVMKYRCLCLFRLDLHFWWYHGLTLLAMSLSYGDLLLPTLSISMNTNAASFLFYGLSTAAQLLLAWRFAAGVHTTYACAYNALCGHTPTAES